MSIKKNLFFAFLAQGVGFVASAATSFVVPKLLGIEEFGYWQLFIFYSTYVGFFHFGLNDGIYLLCGGVKRERINKRSINSQFLFSLGYQVLIAFIIFVGAILFVDDSDRRCVWMFTALFLLLNNSVYFFGLLFQSLNETKLFSVSVIVDRFSFLLALLILLLFRASQFEIYIIAFAISKSLSLLYCLLQAKDFLTAGFCTVKETVSLSLSSIRVGSKLMLANIADMLILGICRALIDANWGIAVFGEVSFSLSLVTFFISFVSQASMVLFPALRQYSQEMIASLFREMRDVMLVLFPGIYLLYFPLVGMVGAWLPQYSGSLHYFALLLPVCVFNTKMDLSCSTYLKVLREEKLLMGLNLLAVMISAGLSALSVFIFRSVELALIGAVFAIVLRSGIAELIVESKVMTSHNRMSIGEIIITVLFIFLVLAFDSHVAALLYFMAYVAYLLCFKNTTLKSISDLSCHIHRR